MTDLETKLAEARERIVDDGYMREGFDVCAAIAREVVAEKDAEMQRLLDEIDEIKSVLRLQAALAEPRKVTDAQREAIAHQLMHGAARLTPRVDAIVAIIESTGEPAAK